MFEFPLEIETFCPRSSSCAGGLPHTKDFHQPLWILSGLIFEIFNLFSAHQVLVFSIFQLHKGNRNVWDKIEFITSSFSHPDDMFAAAIGVMNKNEKYWHISVCACTRRSNKAGLSAKFQSESNLTRGLNRTMADGNWYMSPPHVENRQFIYIYLYNQYWAVIDNKKKGMTACQIWHETLDGPVWGAAVWALVGEDLDQVRGGFLRKLFLCINFTSPPQCTFHKHIN